MSWFRRRRSSTPDSVGAAGALVPVTSLQLLERNERALKMLAVQAQQVQCHLIELDGRVNALAASLLPLLDTPSYDDVLEVRMHSARVAAEVSRLEINIAARIDALRDDLRPVTTEARTIDLRGQAPDTLRSA